LTNHGPFSIIKTSYRKENISMPQSRCPNPKCSSSQFELQLKDDIAGQIKKMFFVQCSGCGTVVGVTDYFDVPTLLDNLAKKLNVNIFD
jgi:hypothetical protein